ncbi:hypothetical protein MFIFM68171_05837 [Madurella fahalii]|uniref:Uncharacterized protein n=1 Tax=Madurella fahalii TaxID=1157608 RepID=A0ABQ0GD17_9PEZI
MCIERIYKCRGKDCETLVMPSTFFKCKDVKEGDGPGTCARGLLVVEYKWDLILDANLYYCGPCDEKENGAFDAWFYEALENSEFGKEEEKEE